MQPKDKIWRALVHTAMPVNCVSQSGTQCEQISISAYSSFLLSSVLCLISTFRLSLFLPYSHHDQKLLKHPNQNMKRIPQECPQTGLDSPISQEKEDWPVGTMRKLRKPWDSGGPCAPLELEQPWCVPCLLCPGRCLPPPALLALLQFIA